MDQFNQSNLPPQPNSSAQTPPPYPPHFMHNQQKRSKWWLPFVIFFGIVFMFVVFIFVIIGVVGSSLEFEDEKTEITENSVLLLDYDGGVQEYSKENPFAFLGGSGSSSSSLSEIIRAINVAKEDDNIKGIYIRPESMVGMAKSMEILDALDKFKESGKFIYAFMEAANENMYMNTLPANKIFMPREGMIELNGFGSSTMFLNGFFKKIGVEWTVMGFEDFKSAGEMYSRRNFSDSSRLQTQVILDQRYKTFVDLVAKYRKMSPDVIYSAMSRGVYTSDTVKALGFIDEFATESQVKEHIKKTVFGLDSAVSDSTASASKKVTYLTASAYLKTSPTLDQSTVDESKHIAIINAVGPISSGKGDGGFDEYEIKSGTIIKYLKQAREDKDVKVVILRIDSPGGSVIASDEMYEELEKLRKVKPVIASMSDVAASGGYYMAVGCDKIVAHPETITGSIGVILALPNFSGTMGMLEMSADTISTSPAAQFMNGMYPYKEADLKQLKDLAGGIYFRFLDKVAKHRKKSVEEIRSVAKGRVWTGRDAHRLGLVDELGGLDVAIKMAKKMINVDEKVKLPVRTFPEHEDPFESILKMLGKKDKEESDSDSNITLTTLAKAMGLDPISMLKTWNALPEPMKAQLNYGLKLFAISEKEKAMIALPYMIETH